MPIAPHLAKRYPTYWNLRRRFIVEYRAAGPVRVVRRRQLPAPSGHGEQGGAHHRARVGQAAGAGVVAELGSAGTALPPELGSAGARVQPAAESDRATDAAGADPLCLPPEDSLAMALYDELVRRGEISMPPPAGHAAGLPRFCLRLGRIAPPMIHSCRCWYVLP